MAESIVPCSKCGALFEVTETCWTTCPNCMFPNRNVYEYRWREPEKVFLCIRRTKTSKAIEVATFNTLQERNVNTPHDSIGPVIAPMEWFRAYGPDATPQEARAALDAITVAQIRTFPEFTWVFGEPLTVLPRDPKKIKVIRSGTVNGSVQ